MSSTSNARSTLNQFAHRIPFLAPWLPWQVLLTWSVLLSLYLVTMSLQLQQIQWWLPYHSDRPCYQTFFLTSTHAVFPFMGENGMISRQVSLLDGTLTEKDLSGSRGERLLDYRELSDVSILEVTSTYEYGGVRFVTLTRTFHDGSKRSRQVELSTSRQYLGIMDGRYAVFGFDSYLVVDCQDLGRESEERSPNQWIQPSTSESQEIVAAIIVMGTNNIAEISTDESGNHTATIQRWNPRSHQFESVANWHVATERAPHFSLSTTQALTTSEPWIWTLSKDAKTLEARDTVSGALVRQVALPSTIQISRTPQWLVYDQGLSLRMIVWTPRYGEAYFAIDTGPSVVPSEGTVRNVWSNDRRFGSPPKIMFFEYAAKGSQSIATIGDELTQKRIAHYPFPYRHDAPPTLFCDGGPQAYILGDYNNPFVLVVDTTTGKIVRSHDWIRQIRVRLYYLASLMTLICMIMMIHTFWCQLPELPAITLSLAALIAPTMFWQFSPYQVTDLCDQLMLVAYSTYALNTVFGRGKLGTRILEPVIMTACFIACCRLMFPEGFPYWHHRISNYVQACIGMVGLMATLWIFTVRKPDSQLAMGKNRPRLSILDFLLLMTAIALLFSAVRGLGGFSFRWERLSANVLHIAGLVFLLALPMVAFLSDRKLWIRFLLAALCILIGLILLATFHRIRGDSLSFITAAGRMSQMSPAKAVLETGINMSVSILGVCLISFYLYACGWRLVRRTEKANSRPGATSTNDEA